MTANLPRYSAEEFARRGVEIYSNSIKPTVETVENIGKFVLIDIESEIWEMDADEIAASQRLDARMPNAQVWMVRVGYPFVRRFGAGRVRTII